MAERKAPQQTTSARKQRAATPKKPAKRRAPRAQSAAVPTTAARSSTRNARQDPPLPAELVAYFGGQETVDLIVHECVPDDASAGDVLRLLLEARRLNAQPLRGDVYLGRAQSRDGGGLGYSVAAKRDCLLRYAKLQVGYTGHDERAIFAKDSFELGDPEADAPTLAKRAGITHKSGRPGDRGDVVGAWAAVEIEGEPPTVRVLDAVDYLGTPEDRATLDEDDVRRRHPDLCMIAAAMSNALRIGVGLNDVVGAEELTRRPTPLPVGEVAAPAIFEGGPVDELDARILDAFRQAQALDALLWPPAKLSATLASAKVAEGGELATPEAYNAARASIAALIEADVQAEIAARRDPVANARRLAELRAFDPESLDEDARREYDTERAALERDEREHAPATA